MTLENTLRDIRRIEFRRIIGETFVWVGNKITGQDRHLIPQIDLSFKEDSSTEFVYKVYLTIRRYDLFVGQYDNYDEAAAVCDRIEENIK